MDNGDISLFFVSLDFLIFLAEPPADRGQYIGAQGAKKYIWPGNQKGIIIEIFHIFEIGK